MVWHGKGQPQAGPFSINTGGGLDLSMPGHLIPKDSLTALANFYYDGYSILPKTRPGLGDGLLDSPLSNSINGIFYYVLDADTSYLVFSSNGKLYYLDGADATEIDDLPNTNPPQFVNFNGVLLIACGDGAPIYVWDGIASGTPVKASGTVTFPTSGSGSASTTVATVVTLPSSHETLTLTYTHFDGSTTVETFEYVTARNKKWQVAYGGTKAASAENMADAILADSALCAGSYSSGDVFTISAKVPGDGGTQIAITDGSAGDLTFTDTYVGGNTQGGGGVAEGETILIGALTYMFVHGRAQQGEVTIGATIQTTAANLVAAIGTDQYDVAVKTDGSASNPPTVVVEATKPGTAGNSIELTSYATNVTMSGANLTSGAQGMALYTIETSNAPTPDILHLFMDRVWAAQSGSDRVYISSSLSHMDWDSDYNLGEYVDIGLRDGNEIVAIGHFKNEVVIHKTGRNPEMYRLVISSPYPATWGLTPKYYENVRAAKTKFCVMSVADRHFYFSNKTLESIAGSDAYDEIQGETPGYKVQSLANSGAGAFVVAHPDKKIFYVSLNGAADGLCYNYAQNKWSTWLWADDLQTPCGTYDEENDAMVFGGADGQIYRASDTAFTDNGNSYTQRITTAVFGAEDLQDHLIKQTVFDFKSLEAGTGTISALIVKEAPETKLITDFETPEASPPIFGNTDAIYNNTNAIWAETFGRVNVGQIASGQDFQLTISMASGGIEINSLTVFLAQTGRDLR